MFKTYASALALAMALGLAAPASAQEVIGVIKSYDTGARVVVLEDGTRLLVSEGVTIREYQPGTRVRYFVEDRGGKRYITRIITTE